MFTSLDVWMLKAKSNPLGLPQHVGIHVKLFKRLRELSFVKTPGVRPIPEWVQGA